MKSERVTLRSWKLSDAEELFRYARDPVIGPACGWAPHADIEFSRHCIREILSAPEVYAVVLRETGLPIGCVALKTPNAYCLGIEPRSLELGFWIGTPYQGRGLAPEASELVIERAFRDLRVRAVWCAYFDGNERSRRAQKKLGFVPHHCDRNAVTPRGDYTDTYYSLLTIRDWVSSKLKPHSDEKYRAFTARLLPGVPEESILGVRLPELRRLAKRLGPASPFLETLPHATHEENLIHSILLSGIRDRDVCVSEIDRFLPFIDNWAVCDTLSPKCFTDGDPVLFRYAKSLILSDDPFSIRFGFLILMRNFTGEAFRARHMDLIPRVGTRHYYVRMAAAWYLAEAMIEHFEDVRDFLERSCPDRKIAALAVRKGLDSFRVSDENKALLRSVAR